MEASKARFSSTYCSFVSDLKATESMMSHSMVGEAKVLLAGEYIHLHCTHHERFGTSDSDTFNFGNLCFDVQLQNTTTLRKLLWFPRNLLEELDKLRCATSLGRPTSQSRPA